jgi:hypothetical protein
LGRATELATSLAWLNSLLAKLQGFGVEAAFELLKDLLYVRSKAIFIGRASFHNSFRKPSGISPGNHA